MCRFLSSPVSFRLLYNNKVFPFRNPNTAVGNLLLITLRGNQLLLFLANEFRVICYSRPRTLIQSYSNLGYIGFGSENWKRAAFRSQAPPPCYLKAGRRDGKGALRHVFLDMVAAVVIRKVSVGHSSHPSPAVFWDAEGLW